MAFPPLPLCLSVCLVEAVYQIQPLQPLSWKVAEQKHELVHLASLIERVILISALPLLGRDSAGGAIKRFTSIYTKEENGHKVKIE